MAKLPFNKNSFSYQNPLRTHLGEHFFRDLPETAGVYFMHGKNDELLYIGKAKSLRARLSTYAQAKPGRAEGRTLELIELVWVIRCEHHATEARALARERDLIRVLRPPYNIAGADEELYMFLGIRRAHQYMEFRLSNVPDFTDIDGKGYEVFGGYRNRVKIKRGYCALLRLIHAYQCTGPRFSYPAKISRVTPPWTYRMKVPTELDAPLRAFLTGQNRSLMHKLLEGMLLNESIPLFMRASIQDDIEVACELYRAGPRMTRDLRQRHGLKIKIVRPEELSELLEKEVRRSLKVF